MPVQKVDTNYPTPDAGASPPPPGATGTGATEGAGTAEAATETGGTGAPPPAVVKDGDTFGGVVKNSNATAGGLQKGALDAGDRTGNSAADKALNKLAEYNNNDPAVISAIEQTAADIKADPQRYLNTDGSIKLDALMQDVASHATGPIQLTPPGMDEPGGGSSESGAGANAQQAPSGNSKSSSTESGAKAGSTSGSSGGGSVESGANSGGAGGGGSVESGANAGSSEVHIEGSARTYPNLGSMADGDIMAIAFIVMMEAAKSAQDDLKSIMDGVKLINKQKDGLRKIQDTINKLAAGVAGSNDDAPVPTNLLNSNNGGGPDKMGGFNVTGGTISFGAPNETDGSVQPGAFSYTTANENHKLTTADINALKDQIKNQLDSKSELGETESLRLQMAMDRVSKFMTALSNLEKKASDTDSSMIQNFK